MSIDLHCVEKSLKGNMCRGASSLESLFEEGKEGGWDRKGAICDTLDERS